MMLKVMCVIIVCAYLGLYAGDILHFILFS